MSIFSDVKEKLLPVCQRISANFIYEMNYGRIRIKRRGGLGFLKKVFGRPTQEEDFLTALNLRGKTVYDIGGHIGVLSVVFAKAVGPAGKVVVFEPNEENCSRIEGHIRLNALANVKLLRLGIADFKKEKQTIIVREGSTGTGSMSEALQSQIIKEKKFKQLNVSIDTLDGVMAAHGLPEPDFIKIDIEGMEYQALLGMSQIVRHFSPEFYIEIHGADDAGKGENIRRVTALFESWGYGLRHVETRQDITSGNSSLAKEGHIFCRRRAVKA